MAFDDDDESRPTDQAPRPPKAPPRPARRSVRSPDSSPPSPRRSKPSRTPIPPLEPLYRPPLEPLYGESFDWSPTHQPQHPRRRFGLRRAFSRRGPLPTPPPIPSPPPAASPAARPAPRAFPTRILLAALRGMSAISPLWPVLLGVPFALTGWACWYLAQHLPGSALSLVPLALLTAAPVVFNGLTHFLGLLAQRTPGPLLPRGAGRWLLAHAQLLAKVAGRAAEPPTLTVARLDGGGTINGYFPRQRVILLADDLIDEPSAAAHSVAAHELGHHLLHERFPRLTAASTWLRGKSERLFHVGLLLLWTTAITGEPRWLALAPLAFFAAGLVQTAIAVEEAATSVIALRELRRAGMSAAQLRLARRFLASALATYASIAAAFLAPLLWPHLLDGIAALASARPPAPPLSSLASWTIALAFLSILSAALLCFRDLALRRAPEVSAAASICAGAAMILAPFIFVLLANQPVGRAAPWPVFFAIVPAYAVVSLPPRLLLGVLAAAVTPTLSPARALRVPFTLGDFPAVSPDALRGADSKRQGHVLLALWLSLALPLAALHLCALFFSALGP